MKRSLSMMIAILLLCSATMRAEAKSAPSDAVSMSEITVFETSAHSEIKQPRDTGNISDTLNKGNVLAIPLNNELRKEYEAEINLPFSVEDSESTHAKNTLRLYLKENDKFSVMDVSTDEEYVSKAEVYGLIEAMRIPEIVETASMEERSGTVYEVEYVGQYTTSVTLEDVGKISMQYAVFSLKDYDTSKNYYSVSALIQGNPGKALDWENYQSKNMYVEIERSSSSIIFEDASPGSTDGSSAYTYEVSGTLGFSNLDDPEIEASVTAGYSQSRTVYDTTIAHVIDNPRATWDIAYEGDATSVTNVLHAAANFRCPITLEEPKIKISVDYDVVKKLLGFEATGETISSSKTITIKSSRITAS